MRAAFPEMEMCARVSFRIHKPVIYTRLFRETGESLYCWEATFLILSIDCAALATKT